MESVRVRVTRIIDFGTTVSIVGIDHASNEPVVIHVDHRPLKPIFPEEARNQSKPISFDAAGLTLCLNISPEDTEGDNRHPKAA